jgi:hypothetical protein
MPRTSITDLDMHAIQVTEQRPDPNIYEFDLTLWSLLSDLAKAAPAQVKDQFGLSNSAIDAIIAAPERKLARLASGVLISFRLRTPESNVFDLLEREYTPIIRLSESSGAEFDSAYWLLLKRIAQRDHLVASTAFGVSREFAKAIGDATDNQLRHIATTTLTVFTLRFDPAIISPLLTLGDGTVGARYFFRKYQQSMSRLMQLEASNE